MPLISNRNCAPLVVVAIAIFLACDVVTAFQNTVKASYRRPRLSRVPERHSGPKRNRNRSPTGQLNAFEGAVAAIDSFYHTQPFLSAFVTASLKASMADLLAQSSAAATDASASTPTSMDVDSVVQKAHELRAGQTSTLKLPDDILAIPDVMDVDVNRNLAFILYGGLYQGMFLQFTYSMLYPFLFGDMPYRIALQVISDVLIFGPLVTLPLAYVIKALLHEASHDDGSFDNDKSDESMTLVQTVQKGLSKYKNHVETQNLLLQYWAFWAPAQVINQNFVPHHLQVAYVACVGFFWIILLSAISSRSETVSEDTTTLRKQHA